MKLTMYLTHNTVKVNSEKKYFHAICCAADDN